MRRGRLLTFALLAVMVTQAGLGLLLPGEYRDVEWIKATWFGNDWVTLVVAVPLLCFGLTRAGHGSVRGALIWFGVIGYAIYNYAFYLFGAALNAFFPLYVVAFVLAVVVLILALSHLDAVEIANRFRHTIPVQAIGGSLIFIGIGLAAVWIAMWAAYVFTNRPTPVEPDAFRLVAALDLSLMAPALIIGGTLLWNRMPWGYVLSAISGIQGTLYLFVLSVNSALAIQHQSVAAPGELPVWGTLTVFTTIVVVILLANIQRQGFTFSDPGATN